MKMEQDCNFERTSGAMPYDIRDQILKSEEAYNILISMDTSKISTEAPFRPAGGEIYCFPNSVASQRIVDGYRWQYNTGFWKLPTKSRPLVLRKAKKILTQTHPINGDSRFKVFIYRLLSNDSPWLFHYVGDNSVYTPLQHALTRKRLRESFTPTPRAVPGTLANCSVQVFYENQIGDELDQATYPSRDPEPTTAATSPQSRQMHAGSTGQRHFCDLCGIEFSCRFSLSRHKKNRHPADAVTQRLRGLTVRCDLCNLNLRSQMEYCEHVTKLHDINAEIKTIEFDSPPEFADWKASVERQGKFTFVTRRSSWPTSGSPEAKMEQLYCNRTVQYRAEVRSPQSPRMYAGNQRYLPCTAFAYAYTTRSTGRVRVTFCLDHCGHDDSPTPIPIRCRVPVSVRRKIEQLLQEDRNVDAVYKTIQDDLAESPDASARIAITRAYIQDVQRVLRRQTGRDARICDEPEQPMSVRSEAPPPDDYDPDMLDQSAVTSDGSFEVVGASDLMDRRRLLEEVREMMNKISAVLPELSYADLAMTAFPKAYGFLALIRSLKQNCDTGVKSKRQLDQSRRISTTSSPRTPKSSDPAVLQHLQNSGVFCALCYSEEDGSGGEAEWIECNVCRSWYHKRCCEDAEQYEFNARVFTCKSCVQAKRQRLTY